jgi:hypothetical protein
MNLYKDIKNIILNSKFSNLNKNFIKSMLDFYKVAAAEIYINFKKDILKYKLIQIDKNVTLTQRDYIIDKIRFNRSLKWNKKKKIINYLEHRFENSLTYENKKIILKNILNSKRYSFKETKKLIDKKINY